jgi:citrate synthase
MKARVMADYLSAQQAATRLGVSRQTLYAYVSRGLLRAHETSDPRQHRYAAEAVIRLAEQRRRGRRPKEVARATLDFGLPVLESAITLIQDGSLYYRGIDAMALARHASLEQVAELLWRSPDGAAFGGKPPVLPPIVRRLADAGPNAPRDEALLTLFAAATTDDATALYQTDKRRFAAGCGALVRVLLACVAGGAPGTGVSHELLAKAWKLDAAGADLLRMTLVVCADHELNASTFTTRCVASTGASVRAAVIAGLAALSGTRHGGVTGRLESFWHDEAHGDVLAQLRRRLGSGEEVPGFGHPLYPEGDPRAAILLGRVLPRFPRAAAFVAAVEELTGQRPNIDFALVTVRRYLRLPIGGAFCLFALGRSVGWIAHALEQRESGQLIRPRAVYSGPLQNGTG